MLTPGTKKLLGSTKIKIFKNKNKENIPHLQITEIIFVHCNNLINDIKSFIDIETKNLYKNFRIEFCHIQG